jgi:hypothetical protein
MRNAARSTHCPTGIRRATARDARSPLRSTTVGRKKTIASRNVWLPSSQKKK